MNCALWAGLVRIAFPPRFMNCSVPCPVDHRRRDPDAGSAGPEHWRIANLIATFKSMRQAPKSATPRSGRMRRIATHHSVGIPVRGYTSHCRIYARPAFASCFARPCSRSGGQKFGNSSVGLSATGASTAAGAAAPLRAASATAEAARNAAGLERSPNQTLAGLDGVRFLQARRFGVSGPFWRGALRRACGGLTSPSSGAPRAQSFPHQLLDHFAPGRLRLRLRCDERVHPS
jgi:hypothetical protein